MTETQPPPARPARRIGLRLPVMLVVFGIVLVASAAVNSAASGNAATALAAGVLTALLGLWVYRRIVAALERRPVTEVAPAALAPQVLRFTGAGIALFTLTIGVIALFGGYEIRGWGSGWAMLATLGTMIGAAAAEELLFRGALFRLVEQWQGTWAALGVSGVLFGALHLFNPQATLWGALAIAAEAGLMLGAAYTATRSLWVPIGLHLGWNFAESGLFGTVVSGTTGTHGLLRGAAIGSDLISGGPFGPEGSLIAILAGAAVTAVFLRRAYRTGRLVHRPRRATTPSSGSLDAAADT
ncbi:type II CAAX endopeptidase family protein [Dactylosporangium matsuzakiense]|uniref:CAAX amino protease n=1 Tax=Dactylosporangium matsuzakiense TaxID=53360 RepID=A0A9W6NPK3_9ACTN|nr:CAAX amino protease [Dactylosporangium matsuzakiense]